MLGRPPPLASPEEEPVRSRNWGMHLQRALGSTYNALSA
jgi:hypothetical protein